LGWDQLQEQLRSDGRPELESLQATYARLNRDEPGHELPPFRALSDALERYLDVAGIAAATDQRAAYAAELDALARDLDHYGQSPSAALGSTIGIRLGSIVGVGQAPELVAAVREQFARPNALVSVSSDLLAAAVDPIDRTEPVTDCILGTSIRSTAHTTGTTSLRTVPADDRALVEISSIGHTVSSNTGHKGPAVIRSTANTDFTSVTHVELTEAAFRTHPVRVDATTSTDIHSVSKKGGGFGSRLVSKIGWQKAHEKKSQAESIAADHAEDRVARRVREETTDALSDAWQRYQDEYRLPLVRRGELPEQIRFSTTEAALDFEVAQANRAQLAAAGDPPLAAGSDVAVRLHETALNNYTASILGGVTISETDPAEGTKADASLPTFIRDAWKERMDEKADAAADANFKPWSLTFHSGRPVDVVFADGKVVLTLHVAQLTSGDKQFRDWDVTGTFTPEPDGSGVTLRRDAELDAFPVDRNLVRRESLSARQAAERRNLIEELTRRSDEGRGFPQTIEVKPLEPSGRLAKVGPLAVGDFISQSGWLTITWNRQ
jgi:hypothetical protein